MQNSEDRLTPLQRQVLTAARALTRDGDNEFHGYRVAKELGLEKRANPRANTTKAYRALKKLEELELLSGRWETDTELGDEGRSRRYLYRLVQPGQ